VCGGFGEEHTTGGGSITEGVDENDAEDDDGDGDGDVVDGGGHETSGYCGLWRTNSVSNRHYCSLTPRRECMPVRCKRGYLSLPLCPTLSHFPPLSPSLPLSPTPFHRSHAREIHEHRNPAFSTRTLRLPTVYFTSQILFEHRTQPPEGISPTLMNEADK
jgi:hypothetical protein